MEALLVMDMQERIVGMIAHPQALLAATKSAIAHAHAQKIPVIYAVVGFRPGYPEVSPNNKSFSTIRDRGSLGGEDAMRICAEIAPSEGDIVVMKRRVSAFTGSDLEVVVRAQGIQRIVLSGIATSGVVLSTLREAADKDYAITVLADCCADSDPEVHKVLTEKVFPRQADVTTAAAWISART